MAGQERRLGWPFWVASMTVVSCLTLGTLTILSKNVANSFSVAGSRQFESVGPAATANVVGQLGLASVLAIVALVRPTWRSAIFVVIALVAIAACGLMNAWAQSSVW